MSMLKSLVRSTGFVATLTASVILLAAIDGASAKSGSNGNRGARQSDADFHAPEPEPRARQQAIAGCPGHGQHSKPDPVLSWVHLVKRIAVENTKERINGTTCFDGESPTHTVDRPNG